MTESKTATTNLLENLLAGLVLRRDNGHLEHLRNQAQHLHNILLL